jgi:hypothetical protein
MTQFGREPRVRPTPRSSRQLCEGRLRVFRTVLSICLPLVPCVPEPGDANYLLFLRHTEHYGDTVPETDATEAFAKMCTLLTSVW